MKTIADLAKLSRWSPAKIRSHIWRRGGYFWSHKLHKEKGRWVISDQGFKAIEMQIYYGRNMLRHASKMLRLDQLSKMRKLPRNTGQTISFLRKPLASSSSD